jgi:beta-aspartyl-peptidase (threonine type)
MQARIEPGHSAKESMMETFTLAIQGGAGTMRPEAMTPEAEAQYHAGLRDSLKAGHQVLAAGGTAPDAVTAAVMALEDNPQFNAGRGAVFTRAGVQEMDAAVMRGQDRAAGAVAGISGPCNPIQAARAVMEQSEHVLLVEQGALDFCRRHGIAFAPPAHFHTAGRCRRGRDGRPGQAWRLRRLDCGRCGGACVLALQ